MKKVWTLLTVALVFSLAAMAWGQKGSPLTEWTGQKLDATDGVKANWAYGTLWTGSATLRKLSIVTHVMGAGDDTIRLFTNQSASPRHTFLLSDTSTSSGTALENRWRKDLLDSTGTGLTSAAAYDINGDGYTDLFAGRAASPYRLKRYYWTGTGWNTDTLAATLTAAINDMDVGDADNDGNVDDIIATSGQVVFHVHWNGAGFDTTRIWAGDASTCYGVAIGDFDADHAGNEVVAVTYGQRVMRLIWNGASWDTTTLYLAPADLDFYEVAVGDFDASNPGAEIAVGNGYNYATYGSVIEVYGSGATWNARALYTSGESVRQLAIGDFLDENPGAEIVIAPYTTPYNVRAIYGSGDTWNQQLIFSTGGTSYGAAVGNVDKYRSDNDEVAITGNYRVFQANQFSPVNELAITAGGPLSYPFVVNEPESIWVRILNNGSGNQPSFDLHFYIDGASYSTIAGLSLNAGDSLDVVLPFTVATPEAPVNFTVYHSLAPDEVGTNDTLGTMDPIAGLARRFHDWVFPANTYKAEGFEYLPPYPPAGWALINNDGGAYQWSWFTSTTNPRQMHSGRFFTASHYESSSLRNDDWLVTDQVSPQAGLADSLVFHYRAYSASFPETLEVWAMSGQTINDTIPGGIIWSRPSFNDTLYLRGAVALDAYDGQSIHIGFRNVSLDQFYIFLDDISWSQVDPPPVATLVSPAWGATGVPVNEPIVIAFSEPMNTGSVEGYSVPAHDFTPSWNATGDTMTLVPDDPYEYGTLYILVATAGTDLAGNSLVPLPDTLAQFMTNQGPNIEMVLQPGDTYDGAGPFLVRAVITDPSKSKAGVVADTLWYTDNATDWWAVSHNAVNADTFDFSIPGPIAPGTVIEYFLGAWDDQGDVTYAPSMFHGYQFRVLSPLAPTALGATAGDMMVQLDWAPPAQVLDYSDGVVTYYWNWNAGDIATTRFSPQHYPCKLEQAVSNWYDYGPGNDSVEIHVWPDDGTGVPDMMTDLIPPFKFLPALYPTANVLDLSSYNVILASGDFHIGYVCQTTDMPTLLSDAGGPGIRSMFYDVASTTWGNLTYAGSYYDYNHQAAVTYSAYTKGLALKSYVPKKSDKPRAVLAGLKANLVSNKQAVQYPELKGALALAKNIQQFNVGRSLVSGGPYTTIWSTTGLNCLDTNVQNSTQYYYVVNAQYTMPDTVSAYSNEATATPAAMPILLVDDDCSQVGWPDRQAIYTAALDGAGYSGQYTVYETDGTVNGADGPSAPWYNNRTHVVWWSGGNWEQSNTLTANDETNLAAYLAAGGRLFYSAQDYIWDRYPSAGAFTPGQFPYDYLGLASADQDAITNPYNIAGVVGSLAEGLAYGVIEDPDVGTYADDLTKQSVAGTYDVLDVTAKVGEKTGVAYDNGTFRTVFFTTLFEDITDGTNTKAELMYRILNWLSTGVEGEPAASAKPTVFSLANNYPNPVRTNTTIKFGLPKESQVRVEVYNVAGQRVKTLADGKLNAGYHQITWKGANDNGQKVAAGVYLVRMVTPEFNATRKMTVIR